MKFIEQGYTKTLMYKHKEVYLIKNRLKILLHCKNPSTGNY